MRLLLISALIVVLIAISTPVSTGQPAPAQPTPTVHATPGQGAGRGRAQASATPTARPAGALLSSPTVALGAMVDGAGADPRQIDAYNALVYPDGGGHVAAVNFFRDWNDIWTMPDRTVQNQFDAPLMDAMLARGAVPFLSWGSCDGATDPSCTDGAIAAGSHDPYLHTFARAAAAWGQPFYLRFDWEMNGSWYPWYANASYNSPASFIAMWRHVHDLFVADGATNVQWVWCPNATPLGDAFTGMYPGDAYVDDVCLDGYNSGTTRLHSVWHSFAAEFASSYRTLISMTSRPVIIGETASTEVGGDKAGWIRHGLLEDLPAQFPRIVAVLWFDANKETDWRVDSSASALEAYRQVAAAPYYRAAMPVPSVTIPLPIRTPPPLAPRPAATATVPPTATQAPFTGLCRLAPNQQHTPARPCAQRQGRT